MKTSEKIVDYVQKHRQVTGQELTYFLGITDRGVRKQLLTLFKRGALTKKGHPPVVYYQISDQSIKKNSTYLPDSTRQLIDKNYLFITPTGEKLVGMVGFES